jgi:hypothetical protein
MLITYVAAGGENVDTNLLTPQVLRGVGTLTKQITYPTADGPSAYTYTGPYYGTNPNDSDAGTNPNQTGHTTPVEGQTVATQSAGPTVVGPTGSPLFPLSRGRQYIGWYTPEGILFTKWVMNSAAAAAAGITDIGSKMNAAGPDFAFTMSTAGVLTPIP